MKHGISAALAAALLFGASTPLAKLLLAHASPWMLAALLYLGSGIGLFLVRRVRRMPAVVLATGERGWLAGAVLAGGIIAPVLLMLGLADMPASSKKPSMRLKRPRLWALQQLHLQKQKKRKSNYLCCHFERSREA